MIVKLLRSNYTLDLNSGRYAVNENFRPPAVSVQPILAGGGSGTDLDGGRNVGERRPVRQFTIDVEVTGASESEVRRGLEDIASFLAFAGDEDEPTFLAWKDSDAFSYEPTWGQWGTYLRYEILQGMAAINGPWQPEAAGEQHLPARISLTIKPLAYGKQQVMLQGRGGLLEENFNSTDGRSQGLMVPETTTNLFTNPIFGHATYDNGWTDESLRTEENNDPDFSLFGVASMKVASSAATNNTLYQSVTYAVASHTITCYAKRPDGDAVTSSDFQIYHNNGTGATTFHPEGNGWYRAERQVSGGGAAQDTGITVAEGRTIYVDGFQSEQKTYMTPLAYGDLLSCAWDSTDHASTTERQAARVRTTAIIQGIGEFTYMIAWKAPYISTDITADKYVIEDDGPNLALYWDDSDNRWILSDGTNTAIQTTGEGAFAKDDVIVFHLTGSDENGLNLYVNGSSIASDGTYTPYAKSSNLYIGTDNGGASHTNGTFQGFSYLNREMSVTEVADDYTDIAQLANDKQRISALPWEQAIGGDSVIDNTMSATARPWLVLGGIPGSHRAQTRYGYTAAQSGSSDVFLSLSAADIYVDIEDRLFYDASGTVTGGTDVGGEVDRGNPGTTDSLLFSTPNLTDLAALDTMKLLAGRQYYMLIRGDIATGSDDLSLYQRLGWASSDIDGENKTFTHLSGGSQFFFLPPLTYYQRKDFFMASNVKRWFQNHWEIRGEFVDSTTGNVDIDYLVIMPEPLVKVTHDAGTDYVLLEGLNAKEFGGTTYERARDHFPTEGSQNGVDLFPERYNHLIVISSPTIADTLTMDNIWITPRYSLI